MISWSLKPFVACRSNWLKGQTVPVIAQASTAELAPAVLNSKNSQRHRHRQAASRATGNDGNSILNRFSSPFKSCNKCFRAGLQQSRLVPLRSNVRDYEAVHPYVSAEIRLESSRAETCKTECQPEVACRASRTFSSCCFPGH